MCIVSIPAIRARAADVLEPEHGSHDALDCPVVLLDSVVEVLRLTQLDGGAGVGTHALDGRVVGAALVDRDLFRHNLQINGTFEESP